MDVLIKNEDLDIEATQRHNEFKPPSAPPPFGLPEQGPSHHGMPFDLPDHGPSHHGMPFAPPPKMTPNKAPSLRAVDPGSIRHCVGKYTYIWLTNGNSFWMYPTHVGRKSVSGYRYGRRGWVYFGVDLDNIESFYCAPY